MHILTPPLQMALIELRGGGGGSYMGKMHHQIGYSMTFGILMRLELTLEF